MSLHPELIGETPAETARMARAAFPKGTVVTRLRDEFSALFEDEDFRKLYPARGQPGLAPWRLALVTVFQFLEHLSDRQAADAVRARIDWKYALGLELTDRGFHFSVLTEFRARLVAGAAEHLLLDRMLECFKARGLVKARGKQRTDSTHVLAAVHDLHLLELVAETLRATLDDLAAVVPDWLRATARPVWFERYGRRVEDYRLPKSQEKREAARGGRAAALAGRVGAAAGGRVAAVVLRPGDALQHEAADGMVGLQGARDRDLRRGCRAPGHARNDGPGDAAGHGEQADIHERLAAKDLLPAEHFVGSAYVDAALLVGSQRDHGVSLEGPVRGMARRRTEAEQACEQRHFGIDWGRERVTCPQGKASVTWRAGLDEAGAPRIQAVFSRTDCGACGVRPLCMPSKDARRSLYFHPRPECEALNAARTRMHDPTWKERCRVRAGIEGTLSQGVRAFGVRRSRTVGLAKTGLQQACTAAAMNASRIVNWLDQKPRAKTRVTRFTALAQAA